jgi:hypothetical protein
MRRACCREIAVSADLVTLVTRAGRGGCLKVQPLPVCAKRVRHIAPLVCIVDQTIKNVLQKNSLT